MIGKLKRGQGVLTALALLTLLIPTITPTHAQTGAKPTSVTANYAADLALPHRAGEVLVRLKGGAITPAAFARDVAAMHDPTLKFALGLHPQPSRDLQLLADQSPSLHGLFAHMGVRGGYQLWPGTTDYKLLLDPHADLAATLAALAADPQVDFAQPNYVYTLARAAATPAAATAPLATSMAGTTPNDPIYNQQWYIPQIHADEAWGITTGKDLTVASIDTGVSASHPDLAGKVAGGYNFVNNTDNYQDDEGHGTMTSGVIAAQGNNGTGIAGVCWGCKILALKAINSKGEGDSSDINRAIRYAADKGVRVINMSLGGHGRDQESEDAVNYAWNKGVFIAASSGNSPDGKPNYPAGFDNSMAVGATARLDAFTGFSSFGPYVDITAPGVGIWSTTWKNGVDTYEAANGTSFSSPLVAGVAALMFSVNPNLSNQQIFTLLENSSDDIGTPGWDEHYGRGRLNALRAVQFAQNPSPNQIEANVALSATSQNAGGKLTVNGSGFAAGETVEVYFVYADGHRHDLATPTADPNGNFSQEVTLPSDVEPNTAPEDYAVRAYGQSSHRDNYQHVTITPGGPPPPPATATPLPAQATPTPAPANTPVPIQPRPRPAAADRVPNPNQKGVAYFDAVGHTLRDPFLSYWQKNGGLAQFGYPLTEPFDEVNATDGKTYTVQYFERNRFESHPENPAGQQVLLGLLGVTLSDGRNFATTQPFDSTANYVYFPETHHSLGNDSGFLDYWKKHGGLAIYGYPISQEILENGYVVQYFQRNRFEYHPELPDPYKVSLGLLGSELMRDYGWIQLLA